MSEWDRNLRRTPKRSNFVIVTVGGDGTILHAARQSLGYDKR
ncbi:MAG: hypothetical protein ACLR7U_02875 [Ruthenibacterium lactatiformans]